MTRLLTPTAALLMSAAMLLPPPPARGQKADPPPTAALGGIAERLARAKAAPAAGNKNAATRFTPSGKRLTLDALVNELGKSPEEKSGLRQVFAAVLDGYEAEAAKNGLENDVAAALAFYLAVHYAAYNPGPELSDGTVTAVARQLQAALETDAMRSARDDEKQRLYEFLVMMGGFTAASAAQAAADGKEDAALAKALRRIGGDGLRSVLQVAPERVRIAAGTGLSLAPEAGAAVAAVAASDPPGGGIAYPGGNVAYRLPAGWTERKATGTVTLQRAFQDDYTNDVTTLLLAPGREKSGSISAAFPAAWREIVLPSFEGEAQPFVYVRRLGGTNCAFSFAQVKSKANGDSLTVFLYLLDAGKVAYPVVGMFAGNPSKFLADVDQVFASLKVAGAPSPPPPLVTAKELAGDWSTSDRTYATYVNDRGDYRGDASSAYSVALTLRADGSYASGFLGIKPGSVTRTKESGTFKMEGDLLVMVDQTGRVQKKRYLGMAPLPDGKRRMLILLNPEYPLLSGNIGLYGEKYVLVVK